jgi:alkanesulfonate monooxygenase SsuD/methylene tetrahydromethanopterin reductase-like flavin-dependent oxidoreductase (luciferase family)
MPWDRRGARTNEQLELFDCLFTQSSPRFDGEFYSLPEVGFEPKPVQSPIPIWVGGNTEAAYRRAARYGSGFHAAFEPLPVVAAGWQRVLEHTEERGRDPQAMTLSLRVYLDSVGSMDPALSVHGSPAEMQDQVAGWAEIGVSHLVLDPVARGGIEGRRDAALEFAEAVMPSFRS